MSVRVVLYDDPGSPNRHVLGPYERVGVDPHFLDRPGCRVFGDLGHSIVRFSDDGWQVLEEDGIPYGRKWARMDVEAV